MDRRMTLISLERLFGDGTSEPSFSEEDVRQIGSHPSKALSRSCRMVSLLSESEPTVVPVRFVTIVQRAGLDATRGEADSLHH